VDDMLFDAFSPAEKHQPETLAVMFPEAQESLPVASLVGASSSSNNADIMAAVATASLFGAVDNLVPQLESTPAARRPSGGGGGGGRNSFTGLESVAPSSSGAMMGQSGSLGAMNNSPGSMFGMGGSPMRGVTGARGIGAMNIGGGGGMGMGAAGASPMLQQMSPPSAMGSGGGYGGGGGMNMQGMGSGSRGSMISANSPALVLTNNSVAPVRQTDPFGDLNAFR
jgi:hypothetical protein